MNPTEYQKLAGRTECDQDESRKRMFRAAHADNKTIPIRINHSIIGLAGEVGELAAILQKWIYYGKAFTMEELKAKLGEEFGDCLWYIAEGLNALGLDMTEVMQANITKLRVRYPDKYSDHHAEHRNLAAEERALANRNISTFSPAAKAVAERAGHVVQDGHGFGHVVDDVMCYDQHHHEWELEQGAPGASQRCRKCGLRMGL